MLRQARERINRIHGESHLMPRSAHAPATVGSTGQDRWSRRFMWAACILAGLALVAFGGYSVELASGASFLQSSSLNLR
jgi:hypothetical protein